MKRAVYAAKNNLPMTIGFNYEEIVGISAHVAINTFLTKLRWLKLIFRLSILTMSKQFDVLLRWYSSGFLKSPLPNPLQQERG